MKQLLANFIIMIEMDLKIYIMLLLIIFSFRDTHLWKCLQFFSRRFILKKLLFYNLFSII